jgi:hypothetical protein
MIFKVKRFFSALPKLNGHASGSVNGRKLNNGRSKPRLINASNGLSYRQRGNRRRRRDE